MRAVLIGRCMLLIGHDQRECWAKLGHDLMETVVPWIPLLFQTAIRVTSPRVALYSLDQFTGYPALDQIALTRPRSRGRHKLTQALGAGRDTRPRVRYVP